MYAHPHYASYFIIKLSVLLLLAGLLLGASNAAAQPVEYIGDVRGERSKTLNNFPAPSLRVPLMQSFFFGFQKKDHHLTAIWVRPHSPKDDQLTVLYTDKNGDDSYAFRTNHFSYPTNGIVRGHVDQFFNRNTPQVPLNKPDGDYIFVLVGFAFSFTATDHHIDRISILENNGNLEMSFQDKGDDVARGEVWYAWVPSELVEITKTLSGKKAKKHVQESIPKGIRVLRGFSLDFEPHFTKGQDHHIRNTGVLLTSVTGDLELFYSDKNGDDGFDWEVRWALMKPPSEASDQ